MIPKFQFHLMGWITLIIFPLPALWALHAFADVHPLEVLQLNRVTDPIVLLGLQFGIFYALLAVAISQFSIFEEVSVQQSRLLKQLRLNWFDILFISFCAGFGEEILFRAGIQHWLGPWWTSIIFVAVHGYLHPLSWRKSLYGFLVMPFIILLAFAYETFGLWFCIAAHFSYDLILFRIFAFKE